MFKKRRAVAPGFRLPPPFNPLAGQHKGLAPPPDLSRVTTMRVKEIHDDYLVCEGWDPDSHTYYRNHLVAKPMALRRNPVKTIVIPGESEEDPDTELAAGESRYDQVYPPYFVGELLVAAKMVGVVGGAVAVPVVSEAEGEAEGGVLLTPEDQTLPDGMPYEGMAVNSEGETVVDEVPVKISEGYPVFWIDLNVAGRTWGASSPIITVGGHANRFSLFGSTGAEYTGSFPGSVELTYANLSAESVWTAAFSDTVPTGFPSVTNHPVFEWQESDGYEVNSLKVKQSGLYRLTLEYSIDATFKTWELTTENTSSASGHVHTYSMAPEYPSQISVGLGVGGTIGDMQGTGWMQFPWCNGYPYMATLAGSLVNYRAYLADATIPVYLSWLTALFEATDKINISLLRLTAERVGDYVGS